MDIYAIIEKSTGKVLYITRNQGGAKPEVEENQEYVEIDETEWLKFNETVAYPQQKDFIYLKNNKKFEARDWMEVNCEINKTTFLANGVDSIIISNLPIPSKVYVNNFPYNVNDGEFEMTVKTPGTYMILIVANGFKDKEYRITAE